MKRKHFLLLALFILVSMAAIFTLGYMYPMYSAERVKSEERAVEIALQYLYENNYDEKLNSPIYEPPVYVKEEKSEWIIMFRLNLDRLPADIRVSVNKKTGDVTIIPSR